MFSLDYRYQRGYEGLLWVPGESRKSREPMEVAPCKRKGNKMHFYLEKDKNNQKIPTFHVFGPYSYENDRYRKYR